MRQLSPKTSSNTWLSSSQDHEKWRLNASILHAQSWNQLLHQQQSNILRIVWCRSKSGQKQSFLQPNISSHNRIIAFIRKLPAISIFLDLRAYVFISRTTKGGLNLKQFFVFWILYPPCPAYCYSSSNSNSNIELWIAMLNIVAYDER